MKNWNDYQLILALARAKSMRAAAKDMGINHATLSRRLDALNAQYDELVFERTALGYFVTPLGKPLLDAAEQIEKLNLSATRVTSSSGEALAGKITLSVPPSIHEFILKDSIYEFAQLYPQIELTIRNTFAIEDLDQLEADIVIRGQDQPSAHLVGKRLVTYSLCFYGQVEYLNNTSREDLRWIGKINEPEFPSWASDSGFSDVPVGLRIDDVMGRHHAALMGYGLTQGACYMADQEPSLIRLPNATPLAFQQLWVLIHPDLRHTPRIQLLMNFLADKIMSKERLLRG